MRRQLSLGDLVTMPLPTEWAPDVIPPGPDEVYTLIPPGSSPAPPIASTGAGTGQQEYGMPGGFGPWNGYGSDGSGPGDGQGPQGGPQSGWNARRNQAGPWRPWDPNGPRRVVINGPGSSPLSTSNAPGSAVQSPGGLTVPLPGTQRGRNRGWNPGAPGSGQTGPMVPGHGGPGTPGLYNGSQGGPLSYPGAPGALPDPESDPTGYGPNWTPQAILPNWMLPPALDRTNPLMRQQEYKRNQNDNRILRQAMIWDWIKMHGGIKSCCAVPELGAPVYDGPPFDVMPSQGQPFEEMFGLPTASIPFTATDTVLGSFTVPHGYDGIINRLVFNFSGNGHADFSGDIVWRVKVALRYVRNFGNVTNTFGSFGNALLVPGNYAIRLVSGQTVFLIANIPAGSPVVGGSVQAGAFGFFYPRR